MENDHGLNQGSQQIIQIIVDTKETVSIYICLLALLETMKKLFATSFSSKAHYPLKC